MFLLQISVCYTQNGNCCITSTIGSMTSGHCILIKLDFECLFKILTLLQDFLILVYIHACSSSKGSIVSMVLVSSCCLWLCSYVPSSEKTFLLREECVCVIPLELGWIFHGQTDHYFEEAYISWFNCSRDPLQSIDTCIDAVWTSSSVCVFLLIVGETDTKSKSKTGGDKNGGHFNKITVVGAGDLGIACVLAVAAKVCN